MNRTGSKGWRSCVSGHRGLGMAARFVLGRRDIADRLKQSARLKPVAPFPCREFDAFEMTPRPAALNHLGPKEADDPSFSPTDRIVAHCDGYSWACSSTIRTARSRDSGEYLLARPMGSILSLNA